MVGEVVLVAVDASKEITDYSLEWAVENVVKPMDSLVMLAILPSRALPLVYERNPSLTFSQFIMGMLRPKSNKRDNKNSNDKSKDYRHELHQRTYYMCVQMMQRVLKLHNIVKVRTEVKVVADEDEESVTKVALELGATWVVLDRCLKKEGDNSMKQLINCNIILVDHEIQKFLRPANFFREEMLKGRREIWTNPTVAEMLGTFQNGSSIRTQSSGLGVEDRFSKTDTSSYSSLSSNSTTNNEVFGQTRLTKVGTFCSLGDEHFQRQKGVESVTRSSNRYSKSQPLSKMAQRDLEAPVKSLSGPTKSPLKSRCDVMNNDRKATQVAPRNSVDSRTPIMKAEARADVITSGRKSSQVAPRRSIDSRISRQREDLRRQLLTRREESTDANGLAMLDRMSSVRKALSVSFKQPPVPPPLCSVCKHNAPAFGRAPRKFTYEEIEGATDGFSESNLLAKGGFGNVYKGVLGDGQVVAVKQHLTLSAQGASQFCSEVEVLSCAQHKNLVMLVGYCIEVEWLLVYEFACNGSLDKHLYGTGEPMAWHNRMKVAVGAARGLRYLHEDCRAGCIVHRDFRPNNILLTHDFEPMVGDFGLARWQVNGQLAEETRVIGAFGYLAPEYTQNGLLTEKADVYAFGVVLLELLTGTKATEFSITAIQPYLTEWSHQILGGKACNEIIDSRLENNYVAKEVVSMIQAASLCISTDPDQRPRMFEVLKVLQGDTPSPMPNTNPKPATNLSQHSSKDHPVDRSSNERLETNRLTNKLPLNVKLYPSVKRGNKNENQTKSTFQHKTLSGANKKGNADHTANMNKSKKLEYDEYQEYLQGSLSRYIQNLNVR